MLVPKEEQDKKMQKKGQQSGVCLMLDFSHHFLKDKNVCNMILYPKVAIQILLRQFGGCFNFCTIV